MSIKNAIFAKLRKSIMTLDVYNPKKWKISRKSERKFSTTDIEKAFAFFNRATNGCFYLIDFKELKFFFGETPYPTICGYSRDVIQKKNFQFYNLILSETGQNWLKDMLKNAMELLYQHKVDERTHLTISYNFAANDINGQKIILHQQLIPCELDLNGNLWRALCFVRSSSFSSISAEYRAKIENYATGDRFDYEHGCFNLSKLKCLTQDEILILKYLANGFENKQIYNDMNISINAFNELKRSVFQKLGVKNQTHAVSEAMKLGII